MQQEAQPRSFRLPRLSIETYAAVGAALVVLAAIVFQKSQATPASPAAQPQAQSQSVSSEESIETILYKSEAQRLLTEAIRVSQQRGDRCYGRGSTCALNLWRRNALSQLESNYSSNPSDALGAYIRIKSIDTVATLQQSPEAETLERFIDSQRRREP